jgi:hypothetical protein
MPYYFVQYSCPSIHAGVSSMFVEFRQWRCYVIEKYPLRDESGKTMFVFEKNGKFYGHIVKDKTEKAPAKLLFETSKFDSVEKMKEEYPAKL